jgi:hypothetical protein
MTKISGIHVPAEIFRRIVSYVIDDGEVTGQGIGVVGDLSLVGQGFYKGEPATS